MPGKKHRKVAELIELGKFYSLDEAIELVKKVSTSKFDGSLEIHLNLGIDTAQADQQLRKTVNLPHGTGKKVRVIAFCNEEHVKEAKTAGASEAGKEELIAKVLGGWMDFDKVVATPDVMKELGKIAKVLGQKGLMPNPKSGTVTTDLAKTIGDLQGGMVEFRSDKQGNLHNIVGKVSFDTKKLHDNLAAYLRAVNESRPATIKGTFIKSITLAPSMGPGVHLEVNETIKSVK